MNREEIIARLREKPPDSDTDVMIEIDPDVPVGVYEYVSRRGHDLRGLQERHSPVLRRHSVPRGPQLPFRAGQMRL